MSSCMLLLEIDDPVGGCALTPLPFIRVFPRIPNKFVYMLVALHFHHFLAIHISKSVAYWPNLNTLHQDFLKPV